MTEVSEKNRQKTKDWIVVELNPEKDMLSRPCGKNLQVRIRWREFSKESKKLI